MEMSTTMQFVKSVQNGPTNECAIEMGGFGGGGEGSLKHVCPLGTNYFWVEGNIQLEISNNKSSLYGDKA